MANAYLEVVRAWAALAWADGKLTKDEELALRRLIDRSPELDPAARGEALKFLESPTAPGDLDVGGMPEAARESIYRAAVQMARIDRDVAADELALLERLRLQLGVDEEKGRSIRGLVLGPKYR